MATTTTTCCSKSKSIVCTGKPEVRFTIFKSKKDKLWYCRVTNIGNREITFQTEGHKNKKDVQVMVVNFAVAMKSDRYEIFTRAASMPL